ncbi:MAG: porin family protein [Ferrovum sp.]|nr:porin family protein [Ferrovum sp.]
MITTQGTSSELDITAMGTYYFDQADTIGLYVQIGVDHTWVSANGISDIRAGVGYGFGLWYHPTKQIETLINLQYYGTGSSNLYYNHNSASILGVAYHF